MKPGNHLVERGVATSEKLERFIFSKVDAANATEKACSYSTVQATRAATIDVVDLNSDADPYDAMLAAEGL